MRQNLTRRRLGVLDLAAVLLFVGIGLSVHSHQLALGTMATVTWPFLGGLAAGWVTVGLGRHAMTSVVGGVVVALITVCVGMILRVISGQGIAFAFVLVAFGFLGVTMVGWRLLLSGLGHGSVPDRVR